VDDREEGSTLRTVATVGIDLAKYVFQLSAVGAREQDVFRQRLSRSALKQFLATLPPCHVGIPLRTALPMRVLLRTRAGPPGLGDEV
jgi:hypothetical protein